MRIAILALGALVLGCAQKVTEPYCYPQKVLESLYTFKDSQSACATENPLIREACLGRYINTEPRVEEAKGIIRELERGDIDISRRLELHRRLVELIDYFNCNFFEDCPAKHKALIRDCYKAKPKPLPKG